MPQPRTTPRDNCSPAKINSLCCLLGTIFPRFFVNLLLSWAAYVLVIDIGVYTMSDGLIKGLVILCGTTLYTLSVYSYYMIVRYGAIGPSRSINPLADEEDRDLESAASLLPQGVLAKENGQQRYCSKCKCWKPDRTHHCSTCKKCVLKMDHHCPWFSICIGFDNHKFFILFLLYVVLFCGVAFLGSGMVLLDWIDRADYVDTSISLNWVFLFILSVVFGIAVTIFLIFQLYQLFCNKTTIESMEIQRYKSAVATSSYRYTEAPSSKSVGNIFDLGWKENFKQAMGDNPWLWFLPVRTAKGNGTTFPINQRVLNEIRRQAEQESQMLSNLQGWLHRGSSSSSGSARPSNVVIGNEDDEYNGRISVEFRPSERRRDD